MLVELEVGFHLFDSLVRDGQSEFLRSSQLESLDTDKSGRTFSAIARLSQSFLQVPNLVYQSRSVTHSDYERAGAGEGGKLTPLENSFDISFEAYRLLKSESGIEIVLVGGLTRKVVSDSCPS